MLTWVRWIVLVVRRDCAGSPLSFVERCGSLRSPLPLTAVHGPVWIAVPPRCPTPDCVCRRVSIVVGDRAASLLLFWVKCGAVWAWIPNRCRTGTNDDEGWSASPRPAMLDCLVGRRRAVDSSCTGSPLLFGGFMCRRTYFRRHSPFLPPCQPAKLFVLVFF